MTFVIPSQASKRHQQLNKNDLSGTIYQSKNINLDEEGYIKLAPASFAVFSTDDSASLSNADAMYPSNNLLFVNSNEVFSLTINLEKNFTNRSTDTNKPDPGVEGDVIYFNGTEVVMDSGTFKYRSASTVWTTVAISLSVSAPSVMCVWSAENSLAVARGNIVKFVNTSWAVNGTILTLPAEHQVMSMASSGSTLYIATRHLAGGEAGIFTINTIATAADNFFGCGTFELPSIVPFKSSVVGVNALGQLVRFTGGGFQELASLPVYVSQVEWADSTNDYSTLANRGIVTDGDLIYINLNALTEDGLFQMLPNFPGGVWCYDSTSDALYHRHSPTTNDFQMFSGSSITVNTTNNNFTLTAGNLNNVSTGVPVFYTRAGGTTIPELNETSCYFLIKDSSTVFRLASTYSNAIASTAIDITGAGSASQDFFMLRPKDYGWFIDNTRKSIAVLPSGLYDVNKTGRIAFSADLFARTSTSTQKTVLCGIAPALPNRGYFITPKFESQYIEDTWQKLYVKHKPLLVDESFVVKYKSTQKRNVPFSSLRGTVSSRHIGTWSDTDTFTTTADLSDVEVGDEIELTAGVGAGHIAHVSSISSLSGTYTVNLDEAFPFAVASDVFYFNVDKWTKLETITSSSQTNDSGFFEIGLSDKDGLPLNSKFIQFKIEMRGIEVTIEELQVSNQGNKYTSVYN